MAKNKHTENSSAFIIFKTEDENISVDVRFEDETVWLTQDQMAMLFGKAKSTISEHIKHIFEEGELDEKVAVRNFRITTPHGAIEGKTQQSNLKLYNLDVIISVGYRVKSLRGTQFRHMSGENLLQNAGSISHEKAIEKATNEYKKYQQKTLSEAEKNYLESLKTIEQKAKKEK